MRAYRNPAADVAVGKVSNEWSRMANLALRIRSGRCNPAWAEEQSKKFTGIYKRLLEDSIDYVEKEARRN